MRVIFENIMLKLSCYVDNNKHKKKYFYLTIRKWLS